MLYKIEFCIDNPMEFFKNLSQIIFYCVTATLAIYGVIKWRKELLGDQKYKLAKNLLAHSYRLRDSIRSCQVSFTPMGEYENREKFENETEHNKSLYDSLYIYQKRFERVWQDKIDLYEFVVEAEAVFGKEAKEKIELLLDVVGSLDRAIYFYHSYSLNHIDENETIQQSKNIIWGANKHYFPRKDIKYRDDDNFEQKFNNSINQIEKYFRPFLFNK